VIDRAAQRPVIMASRPAGMGSRKSRRRPRNSFSRYIHPTAGLEAFQAQKIAFALGLEGPAVKPGRQADDRHLRGVQATDASMIEINPPHRHRRRHLLALDAR